MALLVTLIESLLIHPVELPNVNIQNFKGGGENNPKNEEHRIELARRI